MSATGRGGNPLSILLRTIYCFAAPRYLVPLFADGLKKIRRSLERVANGQIPWVEKIGILTEDQLNALNKLREADGYQLLSAVVVCNGKHLYDSRCVKDGYSIDEVLALVEAAFDLVRHASRDRWGTILVSDEQPPNDQGHRITYEMVFECTSKYPKPSLFSVIPRNDGRGPAAKRNPLEEGVSAKL
jgi:hypothetical protein